MNIKNNDGNVADEKSDQFLEHYKLGKIIGEGSYGNIIECQAKLEDKDMHGVVKRIHNWDKRLTPFLETSIMTGVIHPNINAAIMIFFNDKNMYILQERALYDLRSYISRLHKKSGDKDIPWKSLLPYDKGQKWCYTISSAVSALHKLNIIHGDIKSSNVLVYDDDSIKLTDFGMSVKKITNDENFSHRICTITHTAPEVLQNNKWNEQADIWSLGCLFYEIMCGNLPFPYQGFIKVSENTTKNQKKTINKYRTLNCIESWAQTFDMPDISYAPRMVDFIKSDGISSVNPIFDDLILKMLQFNPKNRLTMVEVLAHPFFKGFSIINAKIVYPTQNMVIHPQEITFARDKMYHHNQKETVLLAEILNLYELLVKRSRKYFIYLKSNSKDDYISWLYSCLWLANISIVNTAYFELPSEYIKVIKSKMIPGICEYLKFYILPFYMK